MSIGNNITLVGNLTRDPELRFTPSGQARALLGIAVNRKWQNRQTNEWEEQVSFFNIVCWGELADNVSESLSKGARVVVTGRLEQRSWDTPEGEKRSVVEVVADEVAPSLRYATAKVERTERRAPDSGERVSAGAGASRPSSGGGDSSHGYDEEPF